MKSTSTLCFVTLLCIILNGGEAYLAHRNKKNHVDTLDKREDSEDVNNNVNKAAPNRESGHTQKELLAMKDVETEIEELLDNFKVAEKIRLNKRVSKRAWWFCDRCDGSKLFKAIAKAMNCKCSKRTNSCKCPNGRILTKDMFEQIRFP